MAPTTPSNMKTTDCGASPETSEEAGSSPAELCEKTLLKDDSDTKKVDTESSKSKSDSDKFEAALDRANHALNSDDVVDRLVRDSDTGELPDFGTPAYWDAEYKEVIHEKGE